MPSVIPALLGSSSLMCRIRAQLESLARFPFPVRLEGPTGSGKGVAARLLHALSPRAIRSFLVCSVAMLSDGTDLDDLVGHRRGAFTGAVQDRAGVFEEAHLGTLFLDEIGEASAQVQTHLLRLIDEKVTRRLGEVRDRPVDVRIVLATNRDLESMVRAGRFREDLWQRLGQLVVRMPALVDHLEDLPELVEHLLVLKSQEAGVPLPPICKDSFERLWTYSWPGNVRQLAGVVEHYVVFGTLPAELHEGSRSVDWRNQLLDVLKKHDGRVRKAALELGVARQTIYHELRRRKRLSGDSQASVA